MHDSFSAPVEIFNPGHLVLYFKSVSRFTPLLFTQQYSVHGASHPVILNQKKGARLIFHILWSLLRPPHFENLQPLREIHTSQVGPEKTSRLLVKMVSMQGESSADGFTTSRCPDEWSRRGCLGKCPAIADAVDSLTF